MFRNRGENLRSVYILLFLNIAFFLLQNQDLEKFTRMFSFDRDAVAAGEMWRLFTYQFVQAGHVGLLPIPPVLTLFLNLILLTLMGMNVEEEWGTFHFINFYLISTLTTAAVAAFTNTPLLGSYFINFTLLFVYAAMNREQRLYLSMLIPIRVTILAWLAVAALVAGVFFGSRANLAALIGGIAGFAYYLLHRVELVTISPPGNEPTTEEQKGVSTAMKNLARVTAVKKALAAGSAVEIDRLSSASERETVSGVNICPPVDFKPEHSDRYCVRCDGFAECTARYIQLMRPKRVEADPRGEAIQET
jgi:membrane associated rhomboid family serine protease